MSKHFHEVPGRVWPLAQRLARRGIPLAILGCFTSLVQAQQNATSVLAQVDPALIGYCQTSSDSDICSMQESSGSERTSLAPDKFVMLSAASLSAAARHTDVVQGRLSEIHAAGSRPGVVTAFGPGRRSNFIASLSSFGLGDLGLGANEGAGGSSILTSGLGGFIRVEGSLDNGDSTNFDPAFKRRATSLTLGADYQVRPDLAIGLALGARNSRAEIDTSDGSSYSNLGERGTSLALYGTYFPVTNSYIDVIAVVGRGRFSTRRDINIQVNGAPVQDTAVGDTTSKETALSIGAGYSFATDEWNWGPYGRLSASRSSVDAFTERINPTSTQLAVAEQEANSLVSGLGGQVSYAWSQSWGVLVPNARLQWNHQFRQDKSADILATFADPDAAGAPLMDIKTTPVDSNYFALDLGVAAHFGTGRSGVLNYSTVLGRNARSIHVLTAELRLDF